MNMVYLSSIRPALISTFCGFQHTHPICVLLNVYLGVSFYFEHVYIVHTHMLAVRHVLRRLI